ncbi:Hypothetical predicted protein [Lecanosticta acicola]|uniref:Uncharacterized protein n=1 Tax=Lecanosticta acicola TaxID=111012 RepID=A0AAI9EF41_9PEZI|nr:Hypothetical predicted protein [Lecanosticta acicola]
MTKRKAQDAGLDLDFDDFKRNAKFMSREITNLQADLKLTNEIHPFFREGQFEGLSTDEYRAIEQSARLASKFLESGSLDNFFHIIFFAKAQPAELIHKKIRARRYRKEDIDSDRKVPCPEIRRVKDLLRRMCEHSHYQITWNVDEGALTNDIKNSNTRSKKYPRGLKSVIRISRNTFNDLLRAVGSEDTPRRIALTFEFAVMLLHEMAHACSCFVDCDPQYDAFFGDRRETNEIGFEMENFLFGGILTRVYPEEDPEAGLYRDHDHDSALTGAVVLWEFPYQLQVQGYLGSKEADILVAEQPKKQRPLDMAWRVPLTFLQDFFRDDFWNSLGSNDLLPKREVAFCFRVHKVRQNVLLVPVKASGNISLERQYVPAGFRRIASGDIVPFSPTTARKKPKPR